MDKLSWHETGDWKNPKEAFDNAVREGRLSTNSSAQNYAGNYMYMGPTADGKHDAFKHSLTRKYLEVK